MTELVRVEEGPGTLTVTMDDAKVNVLSPAMQAAVSAALDRAEAEGAVVVLAGRPGTFSAGFDLKVLRGGGDEAVAMLFGGFELAARLLAFPTPVVVACTGHAVAMGLFLALTGDVRLGAEGPHRLWANEVAIGLPLPHAALTLCRHRLPPAAFDPMVLLAQPVGPTEAAALGVLDRVVPADELAAAAGELAARLAQLDLRAHAVAKTRARAGLLAELHAAIEADRRGTAP